MAHGNKLTPQEIVHAFDAGNAVWTMVKDAVTIDRAYVAAHKELSSETLSYCRVTCLYWAGIAEGIRQERKRQHGKNKRRCELFVDLPSDICKRISNRIEQM